MKTALRLSFLVVFSVALGFARPAMAAAPAAIPHEVFEACPSLQYEYAQTYPVLSLEAFKREINAVKERYFPDLREVDPEISLFEGGDDFLHASVDFRTVFRAPDERTYRIMVNQRLLDTPPSPVALDAILTHELKHVADYSRLNWPALFWFGMKYELFPIAGYEHKTDEAALANGQACGLIEYRLWLYSHEAGKGLEEKVRDYYSPDEILEWMRDGMRHR